MRRRTVIASIPGVLVAGCTSGDDGTPEQGEGLTPTATESANPLGQSRAVESMHSEATSSTPELTVTLQEDAEVPGESASAYVPLETIRVEDAFTRSWSETTTYDGQSELTVSVEPPEWPAKGAAVGMNSQFDERVRERIRFEVTEDGTVTVNGYSSVHD